MPHIDFSAVEEPGSFVPVPHGRYRVRVLDVEESATQRGDEMWKLAFAIIEGEHEGRQVYDNLVFSTKAAPRLKMFCSRLGLDVSGALDLTPDMLLGRTCLLTVEIGEYIDADGKARETNRVPFAGYERDPEVGGGDSGDDAPLPF